MNHDNQALNILTEGGASPEDAVFILDDLKYVIDYTENHLGEQEMVNELTLHWHRNQMTDSEYGFPNWEQFQSLLNHLGIDLERMQQELNENFRHDDH
jgi:3-mercaptopyruvate sulfurtransferase SseA